jgi:hypothetical protein
MFISLPANPLRIMSSFYFHPGSAAGADVLVVCILLMPAHPSIFSNAEEDRAGGPNRGMSYALSLYFSYFNVFSPSFHWKMRHHRTCWTLSRRMRSCVPNLGG